MITTGHSFETQLNTYAPQPVLLIESVPGGFIVSRNGQREVARNIGAAVRILRDWAAANDEKQGAA